MFAELRIILLLAFPLIANGLLESSYGFLNTFLVAHLGEQELAAAGLVSILFTTIMVIFWGIISASSIIISHYHGAEDKLAIRGVMRDSVYFSLLCCIPVMAIFWFAPDIFQWTGQSDFIVNASRKYLHALMWSTPFNLVGLAFLQLFQGISRTRINFWFTISYMPFLIFINYLLMFGKWGLPAMGLPGIGWGTTIAYAVFLLAIILFIYYMPFYRDYCNFNLASPKRYFGEILKVGLPMGMMYFNEVGYFFVLTVFIGKISEVMLSAHQITIQYFWVVMTLVFCFNHAFSIRVGWRLGRKEPNWIMPITLLGIGVIILYTVVIGLFYWFMPNQLVQLDFIKASQPGPLFMHTAVVLFFYLAFFQLMDGVRLTLFSILRGIKDTGFPLLTSLITFWGIALPIGYHLAFVKYANFPQGLWIGLIISAAVNIVLLALRLRYKILKINA